MRTSHALGLALAGSQIAYGLDAPRPPWMTRAIVGLLLTTSTTDAIEQRGARGAAVVAAAGSIGFGAELLGVHTGKPFGPYDYSGKLGPKIADVPVMAAAAWALLARPSRVAGDWATDGGTADDDAPSTRTPRRRAARVVASAAALTAWDVFLDPRMVREGYWTWPGGGRYEGIPATNYLGWFATGLAIFAAAELIDPADDPATHSSRRRPATRLHGVGRLANPSRLHAAFPGERSGDTALALFAWTWIGEIIANVLLWRRPRVAWAGGLSMALVAVPALARRIRAALPPDEKHCTPR
ncbi:MAG: carotenoid biosynthesis protein [Solirubrobacteraceae bacterium]|nr:carotenoid biosynthesis protein [Patulibacter sp.]